MTAPFAVPQRSGGVAGEPFEHGSPPPSGWIDSHCHLQDADDVGAVIGRARAAGVDEMICVGTGAESSRRAVALAGGPVWATIGVHPHDASTGTAEVAGLLEEIAAAPGGFGAARVVGVGECGLDFHYDHSPRHDQREAFAAQIALARRFRLTLVVHTREAWDETFDILGAEGVPERLVFHCFTGGPDVLRRCLDLEAWVSFSGIVTFPNASEAREAAALCPAERLCVETDAPYLAPVPFRGRPNEPSLVPVVGAAIATVRGVAPQDVAASSSAAARAAFGASV